MIRDDLVRTCDKCDDDTTEAETIQFKWNGQPWAVDLCEDHAVEANEWMDSLISCARFGDDDPDTDREIAEGMVAIKPWRHKNGKLVLAARRKTPAKCPVCKRKFLAMNGMAIHMMRTHSKEERDASGWYVGMPYEAYLQMWPDLDVEKSSLSLAGLVDKA